MSKLWTPAARFRLYLIALSIAPLLTYYGLRAETEVGLWVGLLGALMGAGGNGLATGHVDRPPTDYNPYA